MTVVVKTGSTCSCEAPVKGTDATGCADCAPLVLGPLGPAATCPPFKTGTNRPVCAFAYPGIPSRMTGKTSSGARGIGGNFVVIFSLVCERERLTNICSRQLHFKKTKCDSSEKQIGNELEEINKH